LALIIFITNIYIEKSFIRYTTTPRLNIFIGLILFACFVFFSQKITLIEKSTLENHLSYDLFAIIHIIFIFFSVIISVFLIITNKNTKQQ
jgi:hypothetical protein